MTTRLSNNPKSYIVPLNVNHMDGRLMTIPAARDRERKEIMVIYGQNTALEQWFGLAKVLRNYGNITVPDLPGHGGMESFYSINKIATLDNMADYIASLAKLRYRRKRFVVVGIGNGFSIVTRMLQRFPDIEEKVDFVVNLGGITRYDDLNLNASFRFIWKVWYKILSYRSISSIVGWALRQRIFARLIARLFTPSKTPKDQEDFSLWLNKINDVRTMFHQKSARLSLDNCNKHLDLTCFVLLSSRNSDINPYNLEQHMNVVYRTVEVFETNEKIETNSIITMNIARKMLPMALKQIFENI